MSFPQDLGRDGLEKLLEALARPPFVAVEIFAKQGASCRVRWDWREGWRLEDRCELGFAVRAGTRHRSGFWAQAGAPPVALDLGALAPGGLKLPPPTAGPEETPDPEVGSSERPERAQAEEWADRFVKRVEPEGFLSRIEMEIGASRSRILSTTGLRAGWEQQVGLLRVEVERNGRILQAERWFERLDRLDAEEVLEELTERLEALTRGAAVGRPGPRPVVLAAPVMARLVEGLAQPLLAAADRRLLERAWSPAAEVSRLWTLVHDGGDPRGLLAVPRDGEGVRTGRWSLVEEGRVVKPLLAWWEGEGGEPGCTRRDGYRDLPRKGPLQLLLEPVPGLNARGLLRELEEGCWIPGAEGRLQRLPGERFRLPVSAWSVVGGKTVGGLGPAVLEGSWEALRQGLQRLGADLAWVPGDGLYGAPAACVEGLEVLPLE